MSTGTHSLLIVSSQAATRISAAKKWLASHPSDAEILVLASTAEAGDDLVRDVAKTSGARFGLTRTTLERLASRLAAGVLARERRTPIGGLSLVAITARAAHMLLAEDTFSYFGSAARRPGFAPAVTSTIEELRMNRVNSDLIRQLPRGGADLAKLAHQIAAELEDARLADRARRYEAAIEAAVGNDPGGTNPVGLPLLLLDLRVASRLEADLIAALARRAPVVFATAAQGDQRTIKFLENALESDSESIEDDVAPSSLASLRRHIFELSKPDVLALDPTITFASWPGEARECVEIVRTIQKEASQGVSFDRMAVFLRSPGEYRPHLEEAFRRADIRAYFAHGTNRPDPAGRALIALLACAAEKLSAKRFAEYISLAQVPDLPLRISRRSRIGTGSLRTWTCCRKAPKPRPSSNRRKTRGRFSSMTPSKRRTSKGTCERPGAGSNCSWTPQ